MSTKCSFFFGGGHNPCCEQHDIDYGRDSVVSRKEADVHLRASVALTRHPVRAWVMFVGVRLLGWIFYRGKND